jgi:AcrR family transcriptional regulator
MARSRSEEAHQRALAAAVDIVFDRGLDGLTVDEVALRSGVAKTTIYRHWPSRLALAVDAFKSCKTVMPTPNTGDVRADLIDCFHDLMLASTSPQVRQMMLALLQAGSQDPEIERLHAAIQEERGRPVRTVLQLAQARGDIGPNVDLELATELLVGPLMFRLLFRRMEISRDFLEGVVDSVLAALHANVTPV